METIGLALMALIIGIFPLAALVVALIALARCQRLESQWADWKNRAPGKIDLSPEKPSSEPAEPLAGVWTPKGPASPLSMPSFEKKPELLPKPVEEPELATTEGIGLEERLGTRLPVWIGSVALFLAGAFLVKLSFDRGWLGPVTRVVLGGIFGLGLLGLGEFLLRRLERIAQGLSGAGVAVLYASLLAAVSLYGLIPRGLGFFLLAVITALAVMLSLRQGPWIAVLGLVGGFVTPLLIGAEEPNAKVMFIYLFILQIGLLALVRHRGWWPLSVLTVAGCAAWTLGWIVFAPADSAVLVLFATVSAVVIALAGVLPGPAKPGQEDWPPKIVFAGVGTNLALLGLLVQAAHFGRFEWFFFGLLAAGCLCLARLRPDFRLLPWFATAVGFVLVNIWRTPQGHLPPEFSGTLLAFGGLMVLGSFVAALRSAREKDWVLLGSISAGLFFLAGWSAFDFPQETRFWGLLSLALATLHAALAIPFGLWRSKDEQHEKAFGRLVLAGVVFGAVAVPLEFKELWWTGLWAVSIPVMVVVAGFLRLEGLRRAAAALSGLVLFRLLVNPLLFEYPVHCGPLANTIIPGIGVPLVALVLAAWFLRRDGETTGHDLHEIGAAFLAALLGIYQIRVAFHSSETAWNAWNIFEGSLFPAECGTILVFLLVLSWILWEGHRLFQRISLERGAMLCGGGAFFTAFIGLAANPLWTGMTVGPVPLWNGLVPAYGLPAMGMVLLSRRMNRYHLSSMAQVIGAASLVYWFHFISLEIRQAFHGSVLSMGETTPAELYSYSAAWVVFGVVLLALGALLENTPLRWASLGVMFLSVSKVFLIDLAELRDFFRVLSLLGLGASLMVLAFVYQRFVFRHRGTRIS